MSQLEIHASSVETIYLPVAEDPPGAAATVLSSVTLDIALPAVGVSPTTWVSSTWSTGTLRDGDRRYYLAKLVTSGFTIAAGTTYQPWVRLGGSGGSYVKVPGTIKVINT